MVVVYTQIVKRKADRTLVVEPVQEIKVLVPFKSVSGLYFPLPCVVVPASKLSLVLSGFSLGVLFVVPPLPPCFGPVFLALGIFAELLCRSLFDKGGPTHTANQLSPYWNCQLTTFLLATRRETLPILRSASHIRSTVL